MMMTGRDLAGEGYRIKRPIMPRPILIAGPTASGKSALAVALARAISGVVVNADSMQVYAELRLLTARPSDAELAQAPHALYGHVPAAHAYSVAQWLDDVAVALAKARAAGRTPVIVGGTGLYFKALLEGLSPVPPVPDAVRAHWRAEARRLGAPALHALLCERDPMMGSRLLPSDPQRLVRALEVLEATGRSLAHWQTLKGVPLLRDHEVVRVALRPDRAWLQARCDQRFDQMIADGAMDEARVLMNLEAGGRLDRQAPVMGALGVRPLRAHLRGDCSREAAVAAGKAETRRYIKRQETWLNKHMMSWNSINTKLNYNNTDQIAYNIINSS